MLDTETKRKIDACRDILVGKVPDPKGQVEQITIALIFKFMDDMDKWSVQSGGKRSFFTGDFEKYGWSNIFNPRVGGHELLTLYSEAIVNMDRNPRIPQLFRDIFKNAYLPYRDPETLRAFLREIGNFTYDHSERLGDAFEYLLSIMSSQGEAGQFRTPRHIIDFIVEVVDPQKNEAILDPACGTAGFLISAYKHILKNEAKLTADQKKRLMENFVGYDISYDMVRLSLVNMYLHGFPQPHIFEYDTLTYENRWDEAFDVIMANPPFMSPKGGIRPHKRFSIQAKRSEVLFVDYIAEHLNPGGRAGVIVPEGIIFQSQKAYKNLRKMLIENYLWAVVSLPAGVFNPYSGVKTSILLMDKQISKKTDKILFVRIENDGFDLGAQRRPIDKNDLPAASRFILAYKSAAASGKQIENGDLAHTVAKKEILASNDISLSGEYYRDFTLQISQWPMVKLGEVCKQDRKQIAPRSKQAKELPYVGLEHINGNTGTIDKNCFVCPNNQIRSLTFEFNETHILYGKLRPYLNKVALPNFSGRCSTELIPLKPLNINRVFLAILLRRQETIKHVMATKTGTRMPRADMNMLLEMKIPLPPLEVQEKIVAEIDGYQKVIDGARQVIKNYKPTIKINPNWPMVKLGEVCKINPKKSEVSSVNMELHVSFIPMEDIGINQYVIPKQVKPLGDVYKGYTYFRDDDVLVAKVTPCFENGKGGIARNLNNEIGFGSSELHVIRPSSKILSKFIYPFISSDQFRSKGKTLMTGTGGLQRVPSTYISDYIIPLPSLDEQKRIVAEIEAEQAIVEQNKKLIELFEKKIADTIDSVWGKAKE